MIKLGTNVAIIQDTRILLVKREDFEVWCIPGGMVAHGESVAQAAIREVCEETGLEVELLRLVGIYSRIGSSVDVHEVLFTARPTGGALNPQAGEVLELRYFAPDALPDYTFWWHRHQVSDACHGVGDGVAWLQKAKRAEGGNSRQELYALRDRSRLLRPEFYRRFVERQRVDEVLEVGETQPDGVASRG